MFLACTYIYIYMYIYIHSSDCRECLLSSSSPLWLKKCDGCNLGSISESCGAYTCVHMICVHVYIYIYTALYIYIYAKHELVVIFSKTSSTKIRFFALQGGPRRFQEGLKSSGGPVRIICTQFRPISMVHERVMKEKITNLNDY